MSDVEYYCHDDKKMKTFSDHKLKRLLYLAQYGGSKSLYHYYYYLVHAGLVTWSLGTAFLTDEGKKKLEELEHGQDGNAAHC